MAKYSNKKMEGFRLRYHLSDTDVSHFLGISIYDFYEYEGGGWELTDDIVLKLCDLYNAKPSDFMPTKLPQTTKLSKEEDHESMPT